MSEPTFTYPDHSEPLPVIEDPESVVDGGIDDAIPAPPEGDEQ